MEGSEVKAKPNEKRRARHLRRRYGTPMKEIAARLNVSPASVYLWTRDIRITGEQRARNMRRSRTAFSETWREQHRQKRAAYQQDGRRAARAKDPLHLAGCMLYWRREPSDVEWCASPTRTFICWSSSVAS
jgi:hypothetical protein